jgi:hypothetical protein
MIMLAEIFLKLRIEKAFTHQYGFFVNKYIETIIHYSRTFIKYLPIPTTKSGL